MKDKLKEIHKELQDDFLKKIFLELFYGITLRNHNGIPVKIKKGIAEGLQEESLKQFLQRSYNSKQESLDK